MNKTKTPSTREMVQRIKNRPNNVQAIDAAHSIVREEFPEASRQLRHLAAKGLEALAFNKTSHERRGPVVKADRAAALALVLEAFHSAVDHAVMEKWVSLEYQGADGRRRALPMFTLDDSDKWAAREAGVELGGRARGDYHRCASERMRTEGVESIGDLSDAARIALAELADKVWR